MFQTQVFMYKMDGSLPLFSQRGCSHYTAEVIKGFLQVNVCFLNSRGTSELEPYLGWDFFCFEICIKTPGVPLALLPPGWSSIPKDGASLQRSTWGLPPVGHGPGCRDGSTPQPVHSLREVPAFFGLPNFSPLNQ